MQTNFIELNPDTTAAAIFDVVLLGDRSPQRIPLSLLTLRINARDADEAEQLCLQWLGDAAPPKYHGYEVGMVKAITSDDLLDECSSMMDAIAPIVPSSVNGLRINNAPPWC